MKATIKIYRAVKNEIRDQEGRQVAVVLASGCSRKDANMMAAFAAQQMNNEARRKYREALLKAGQNEETSSTSPRNST